MGILNEKRCNKSYETLFGPLYVHTFVGKFAYESFEQMIESIIKRQTLMKNKPNNPKIFVIIDSVTYEKQNLIYSPACKYLFENMQDLNIGNIIVIDTKIPDPSFQFDIIKKNKIIYKNIEK